MEDFVPQLDHPQVGGNVGQALGHQKAGNYKKAELEITRKNEIRLEANCSRNLHINSQESVGESQRPNVVDNH
jgi:hypothetical protein